MNKALLGAAGVALLGTAGVAAVIVASPGGDEEVVQQPATAMVTTTSVTPAAPASATPSPAASPTTEASPGPIPADWQTYNDPVLGFSLRYSPDLVFKDRTQASPIDGLNERALEFRSSTDPTRGFSVSISSNSRGLTPEQSLSDYGVCLPGTMRQGTVASQGATFCTSEPAETPEAAVAFEHTGKMCYITAVLPPAEFEQILGSLRVGNLGCWNDDGIRPDGSLVDATGGGIPCLTNASGGEDRRSY